MSRVVYNNAQLRICNINAIYNILPGGDSIPSPSTGPRLTSD